jgi:L-amino acid N-acyltransferase YncA
VLIRAARATDASAIAKVHVDSWRTTYAGIVPDDYLTNLSYEQRGQYWRDVLAAVDRPAYVYVAQEIAGQIIGFASGGPERSGDAVYKGELYAIYLLDRYQRQGMGRKLTVAVVKRLLQHGLWSMLVWVLAVNPSRAFYEALGGQQVYEKEITIGGALLVEVAYGWRDIHVIAEICQ